MSLFDPAPFNRPATFDEAIPPDPRTVPCPGCHAPAGSPCRRPSGHNVFGGGYHAPRREAARSANPSDGDGTVPSTP